MSDGDPRTESSDVVVWAEDGRLLVAGEPGTVDDFLSSVGGAKQLDVSDIKSAADGIAVLTSVLGVAKSGGRYVELSKQSWERFDQLQSAGGGWVYGFARDAGGKFAGNATMRKAALNGPRALSLQATAIGLAIRLAVQEAANAVEAVAADVEDLRAYAEAVEIGNIAGLYRVLANARKQADDTGRVSKATWDAIATHEVTAQQGADRARALIRRMLRDLPLERDYGDRADAAARLVQEQSLERTLQLLVLAEQCRLLYRSLKLEHVQGSEPEEVEGEIAAAQELLTENAAADRELIDQLHETVAHLARSSAMDGFRLFGKDKLPTSAKALRQQIEHFADLRGHQLEMWAPAATPSFGDAVKEVGGHVQRGAIGVGNQVGGLFVQLAKSRQSEPRESEQQREG